jgi:hypothetical protein
MGETLELTFLDLILIPNPYANVNVELFPDFEVRDRGFRDMPVPQCHILAEVDFLDQPSLKSIPIISPVTPDIAANK